MSQARALPELAYGTDRDADQASLPLASEGVQRVVWHMRYGDILIEVRDGVAWVNGQRVDPAAAPGPAMPTNNPQEGSL
jgi:hypothetical protein